MRAVRVQCMVLLNRSKTDKQLREKNKKKHSKLKHVQLYDKRVLSVCKL